MTPPYQNTSQDGLDEWFDEYFMPWVYLVQRQLNSDDEDYLNDVDKITKAKAELKRLLLQERLEELKQAKFKLIHAMPLGLDDEEEMMLSGDYLNYRIATLTAQLSKNEMGDE